MSKLILIGGGHSHVIALKLWHQKPLANVEITLISNVKNTPYSGMLPAHLAGYYSFEETHINLLKLSQKYGIKLIIDTVNNIDTYNQEMICQSGQKINYDLLSVDIGSTPIKSNIIGAEKYAIPAKPVPQLLEKWQEIVTNCQKNPQQNQTINIVGGGAGGVELALNIHQRLTQIISSKKLTINLITRGNKLVKIHNNYASYKLEKTLKENKINLHFNQPVTEICSDYIITASGAKMSANYHFLVTTVGGALWLKHSQISTDEKGFILVNKNLQSISHDNIFASGDIATMINHDYPKAGVFAVRQGKPLAQNWRNWLQNRSLQPYQPQSLYLSIIGLGRGRALVIWGYLALESPLFWYWKEYLDRRFMKKFGS